MLRFIAESTSFKFMILKRNRIILEQFGFKLLGSNTLFYSDRIELFKWKLIILDLRFTLLSHRYCFCCMKTQYISGPAGTSNERSIASNTVKPDRLINSIHILFPKTL